MKVYNKMKKSMLYALAVVTSLHTTTHANINADRDDQDTALQSTLETSDSEHHLRDFIVQLGNEIIRVLAEKKKPMAVRKNEFKHILTTYFDMPTISQSVLGKRNWNDLSAQQKQSYADLFLKYVVEIYADKFKNYNGQTLQVKRIRTSKPPVEPVVYSDIVQSDGTLFHKIEWTVAQQSKIFKVKDIKIEGISMCRTLSVKFQNTYKKGQFTALQDYLERSISGRDVSKVE